MDAAKRVATSTAPQKLYLLNSGFVMAQAERFAASLLSDPEASLEERVEKAYARAFSRRPTAEERALGVSFLRDAPDHRRAWRQYAQALLVSNEMFYVD